MRAVDALSACELPSPRQEAAAPACSALVDVYSELGSMLARGLRRGLDVHDAVESAAAGSPGSSGTARVPASMIALPHTTQATDPLPPAHLTLQARVEELTRQVRRRTDTMLRATSGGSDDVHDAQGGEGGHDELGEAGHGLRSGPPSARELAVGTGIGMSASGGGSQRGHHHDEAIASFRQAYMQLLAEGAADELDALRCEEPPMDEAALELLIDALEFGAETFPRTQHGLVALALHGATAAT